MSRRQVCLLGVVFACALVACDRGAPTRPAAGRAAAADARHARLPPVRVLGSGSDTGEAANADARPLDPGDAATYRLPGKFTPASTETALRRQFGDGNVRIADVPGGEGETSRGVILFPTDPSRRAYLYFQDAERLRGLRLVRVMDAGSRWRLDHDIGVGTPFSKLLAMNGKPIRFSGFDWDYGGGISDWNGGRLEPPGDAPQRRIIRLAHGDAPPRSYPMGDAVFSSDDPRYPRLGDLVFVGEIGMAFPGQDDL